MLVKREGMGGSGVAFRSCAKGWHLGPAQRRQKCLPIDVGESEGKTHAGPERLRQILEAVRLSQGRLAVCAGVCAIRM